MSRAQSKNESAAEKKLRLAQEIIQANKKKQQQDWQDKWKAQAADPEYQRKQAERAAKSEERSRTTAINKENKVLALITNMSSENSPADLYETAVHEACHAVMQELVANGVRDVTIVPGVSKSLDDNGISKDGEYLGTSVSAGQTIGTTDDNTVVWRIATSVAPQIGVPKAFPYYEQFRSDYDEDTHYDFEDQDEFEEVQYAYLTQFSGDEKIIERVMEVAKLNSFEGWKLRSKAEQLVEKTFEDMKVWAAVMEVADALMTDKTLSGNDVRLIVRKHTMPHLGVQFDAGKQLSFHFRKNRYQVWREYAPFVIGIGVTTGTSSYNIGYRLSQPKYVDEVTKANVQPMPFPMKPIKVKTPSGEYLVAAPVQTSFVFPHVATPVAPVEKSRRKKAATKQRWTLAVGARDFPEMTALLKSRNDMSHFRHCLKHRKPLPCAHCALAAKPLPLETPEPEPVPEIHITRYEPAPANAKPVPRSMISPEVRRAIDSSLSALPAKDAPIIQQETVETSTGAKTLAAADDGIVDTDDAAEQGFSDKYRPRNTKLPAPPKREPTKQPAYLKSVAQPVVPTNNPAAPFGYDDNDRPIGVPVGKPYVKPVQTGTIERSERGPLCKKFADWFDAQNLIVKEGEDGFLNFAQLLRELRGREVTTDTLFQAMGRISYRPGRQLAYVQKERKQVDPSYKPGQFLSDYNVSPGEHQRRLRASRTQEQDSQAARHSRDQAVAKHEAEKLRSGYSHAEDAQVSKLFVTDPQTREIEWVATKNARSAMLQRFANRRARLEVIS